MTELSQTNLIARPRAGSIAVAALLVCVAGFRLALVDRGARSLPDELNSDDAFAVLRHVADGELRAAAAALIGTEARPGDTLLRLPSAGGQTLVGRACGVAPDEFPASAVPAVMNVIVSTLLVGVAYRIALLLFSGDRVCALAGTFCYAALANSNLYVRHVLPYDASLLVYLFTTNRLLRAGRVRLAGGALAGAGAAFAHSVYPGYYMFAGVLLALSAFVANERSVKFSLARTIPAVVGFVAGFVAVIGVYEIVGRLGGASLLWESLTLQGTITQGTFGEGFSFAAKYLVQVEGAIGILILVFTAAYALRALRAAVGGRGGVLLREDPLLFPFACVAAAYMAHATAAAMHRMVFYGRILHMYAPFAVWAGFAYARGLPRTQFRTAAIVALVVTSALSFALFARRYLPLAYPKDVLRKQAAVLANYPEALRRCVCESRAKSTYGVTSARQDLAPAGGAGVDLVNFAYYYPVKAGDFRPYEPSPSARLAYRGAHFLSFAGYAFEGFSARERQLLRERKYRVAIYEHAWNHVLEGGSK